jgi:hypothetical protein
MGNKGQKKLHPAFFLKRTSLPGIPFISFSERAVIKKLLIDFYDNLCN